MGDGAKLSDDQKRRRVAEVLVKPLVAEGMKRERGVTLEAHEKWIKGLKTRLAYMDPENLIALRHGIARAAGGKHRNTWPSILTITNFARALQRQPDDDDDMVTSYMASRAGREAWERGPEYAVALRQYMRTVHLVPHEFTWPKINASGAQLTSKHLRISKLIEEGRASEEDMRWHSGLQEVIALTKALVFAKKKEEVAV
jgi:hypothetical protein